MGKVFPQPSAAPVQPLASAVPLRKSLFDFTTGIETPWIDKPRSATGAELRAYLLDLADRRGVHVPDSATISEAGIYDEGAGYIVAMPGYGDDAAVIMEELDEAGDVVRSSRIGVDRKGALGLKADAIRKTCALPKVRKPRATKAKAVVVPAVEPVERVPAVSAPVEAAAPVIAQDDALAARVAALEAIVARLSRPVVAGKRQRSEAERRAVLRAWRMRGEMRARADLDRRALLAANEANRTLRGRVLAAETARDLATEQAANARDAATAYKRDSELHWTALRDSQARALRMVAAAKRYRTAAGRAALDLRGAQAEARALSRRLADAPMRARSIPAISTTDSGAVAALAA